MAVTTGMLEFAVAVLATEAFAGGVAAEDGGADFFSAAGLGFGAAAAGLDVAVVEGEVAGSFAGSIFSGLGGLESFGGAAVFAVVAAVPAGFSEATVFAGALTGTGSGFGDGAFFASGDSLFAAGWLPGAEGTMEAILSFSTNTNPKSVLTLNMLSSYATITP